MSDETKSIEISRTVNAPPSQVYYAFTNAVGLREWLADVVEAEPQKDGRLYLWWKGGYYACGRFESLEPDKRVVFSWHGAGEPSPTKVTVSLEEKDGGAAITLKHEGLGSGKAWEKAAQEIAEGWEEGLENLQSVLEDGLDMRLYRRPMLGIIIAEMLTENRAAELGVPVHEGIELASVSDDMGAEAAGLREHDVIVGIGSQEVKDYDTLIEAIDPHAAGDTIEVVYYRGSEKASVQLTLSQRPAGEVPPTPAGLAEALRKMYKKSDAAIAEYFQGASEEAASRKPAPDSWSANETLAHLILSERYSHEWIGSLVKGDEMNVYSGGLMARLEALAAAYGTAQALLETLRKDEMTTVAMVELLPAELVARKSTYVRLGRGLLHETLHHLKSHFDQFEETLAAGETEGN